MSLSHPIRNALVGSEMSDNTLLQRQYLTRKEAAAYISRSGISVGVSTLNKYARLGTGPGFIRINEFGPTYYAREALDVWIAGLGNKPR